MKLLRLFFIILIFQINFSYTSAESNVAFVDMQYLMDKSLAGQSLKKQLENLHKKNLDYFKKEEDFLKKKEQEVISKKNILSKEDFQEEISNLRNKVKNYQAERNEKINSLTKKRLSSMETIIKNLSPILAEYSKENNISIIMDKKNIIVGKTELDITKKILVLLDKKIKKIKLN
tara:strand:- start:1290 stop:1814 length:525 start_codon:yes stop_codon:yes gene_type:complete